MKRRIHRTGVVFLAAALATFMIAPASSLASTPHWAGSAVSVPSKVSSGANTGYAVTITNNGPSNISALYLGTDIADSPVYVYPPSQGSCSAANVGSLTCSFGALKAGATVTLTVVYKTHGSDPFAVTFLASTTGNTTTDKGHTSHGDTLPLASSTALSNDPNFAGGFVIDGSPITTGGGDDQQTTVTPVGTGFGVTITEGSDGTNPCGSGTPIGQPVVLNVNNGTTFSTPFLTTLTIPTSTLPHEKQLSDFRLCHQYDNSATGVSLPKCASDAAPTNGIACFWPKWQGNVANDDPPNEDDADNHAFLVIDMFDYQNGTVRGTY